MTTPSTRTDTDRGFESMADVVEDLFNEFASTLAKSTVLRVVRLCGRELAISGSSSPYLLHNRARRRLRDRAARQQTTARGDDQDNSHRLGHDEEKKTS